MKGQRGEREAVSLLRQSLGAAIVEDRDLAQCRDGGGDVRIPAARVVVEVKRTQARAVPTWLAQARATAAGIGPTWVGVVLWRRNRAPWRAWIAAPETAKLAGRQGMGLEDWLAWVRGRLTSRVEDSK
jgi:hypothetical protein